MCRTHQGKWPRKRGLVHHGHQAPPRCRQAGRGKLPATCSSCFCPRPTLQGHGQLSWLSRAPAGWWRCRLLPSQGQKHELASGGPAGSGLGSGPRARRLPSEPDNNLLFFQPRRRSPRAPQETGEVLPFSFRNIKLLRFVFQTIALLNIYRNPQNSSQSADGLRCKFIKFLPWFPGLARHSSGRPLGLPPSVRPHPPVSACGRSGSRTPQPQSSPLPSVRCCPAEAPPSRLGPPIFPLTGPLPAQLPPRLLSVQVWERTWAGARPALGLLWAPG